MFHVVTFEEYLNIMWSKVMVKVATNEIKECKQKEKEEKKSKRVAKTFIIVEGATQRSIKKWTKVLVFMQAWFTGWFQGRVVHFLSCNLVFYRVVCIYMLLTWHYKKNQICG